MEIDWISHCILTIGYVLGYLSSYIIFRKNKPKKVNDTKFNIRHFPRTGIWVSMYKGSYLDQSNTTGIIRLSEDLFFATQCKSENQAINIIEKYKEQRFNKNVENIPYDN